MKRVPRWAAAAAAFLVGCVSPDRSYIEADRLTYEAIAPEYRAYVEADAQLDADARARRLRTLETWDRRIRAGEEATDGR